MILFNLLCDQFLVKHVLMRAYRVSEQSWGRGGASVLQHGMEEMALM